MQLLSPCECEWYPLIIQIDHISTIIIIWIIYDPSIDCKFIIESWNTIKINCMITKFNLHHHRSNACDHCTLHWSLNNSMNIIVILKIISTTDTYDYKLHQYQFYIHQSFNQLIISSKIIPNIHTKKSQIIHMKLHNINNIKYWTPTNAPMDNSQSETCT